MSIISIEETTIKNDHVTVTAMVEDAHLKHQATHIDPPEYVPGLCQASFYVDADQTIPTNEGSFIDYLDSLGLQWHPIVVDNSDYY